MKFVKMHGIGNDYVFVDTITEEVKNAPELARKVSPRHFSVGSDGLILITPSEVAHVGMRIFNADGSEAEMCGNGVRCVAKYVWDHGICRENPLTVETASGCKELQLHLKHGKVVSARVDMGEPRLKRSQIPMRGGEKDRVVDESIRVGRRNLSITCLSMGNPHCIIPVREFDFPDWRELGEAVEKHELFPERINVHFVKVRSESEMDVKTWERGSGATLACGSGASAVGVAANMLGYTGRTTTVNLPGGSLEIEWSESSNRVYMTGPAVEVFSGNWPG